MICPKCGKDVGDYKYCPDCAVPAIQIKESVAQSGSELQSPVAGPAVNEKKKTYGLNRFFAIVISLQIVFCLVAYFFLLYFRMWKGGSGGMMVVCALQIIGSVACLVLSPKIKFWMMFPYTVTGALLVIHMVNRLITSEDGGGCLLFLIWPIMFLGVISAILAPISKIPHKEDA